MIVDAQNEYDHGLLAISDVQSSRKVIGDVLRKYRGGGGDVVSSFFFFFCPVLAYSDRSQNDTGINQWFDK